MYVLKHGNQHFRITCNKCKAILEFDLVDIEKKWNNDTNKEQETITCPECGNLIWVNLDRCRIPDKDR